MTRFLNAEITAGLTHEEITPAQANALRELTRFTGSALRAAANPNDPMHAFAQDYLGQLLGPGGATNGSDVDTTIDNNPVDAETQQEIASARAAIASGDTGAAAEYLNNIVERRAADNPDVPRADIANQLMRELGIKPDTLGFAVGANGNVAATERVDRDTAVARIAAAYQRNDPALSQQEAERLANDYINRRGIPSVFVEMMIPEIVVRPDKPLPFTTGNETVDRVIGALQGAAVTGYNQIKGIFDTVVSIGQMSADGILQMIDLALPESIFTDSAARNQARIDLFNNIIANIDKLPSQILEHLNARLERANELDRTGNFIAAARERTEMFGDLISMVINPRSPNVLRILERLGIDPAVFQRMTPAQALERRIVEIEAAAAREGLSVVHESRGNRGDWNAALNGEFKPNAVYILDNGHHYTTDASGRVSRAEGVLNLAGIDRNTYQQVMAGRIGGDGYDGGHLIANLFGGAGERINLVPMLSTMNRGEFRAMELEWANALRAGRDVRVEVSPVYSGNSKVPDTVLVRYTIDGQLFVKPFNNK